MAEHTNGDAVKTAGSHTLNGDPSAAEAGDVTVGQVKKTGTTSSSATADPDADGSAEAEDATGGQGNAAMGNNSSSSKDVTVGTAKGMGNGSSSDPAGPSAAINTDGSSSPVASKAPAALTRVTSLAARVAGAVSNNLSRPARAALTSLAARVAGAVSNNPSRAAFVALTSLALWRAADEPRRVVWTFSAIAISYLTLWTICLTAAIRARDVLVSVSYVALVAVSATHLSSPAGILFILLDAAYAAGLCGYALAEYRQRKGLELAAISLHASTSKEELEDEGDAIVIAMASFYSTVASVLCAAAAAWVVYYYGADMYWVIVVLSLLIDFSLFCWMALVAAHLLRGALLGDGCIAFIYWCPVLLFAPDLFLSYLFDNAIGVLVHPLGVMGIAGLLGYNLGLYARYKQMLEGDNNGSNKKLN